MVYISVINSNFSLPSYLKLSEAREFNSIDSLKAYNCILGSVGVFILISVIFVANWLVRVH